MADDDPDAEEGERHEGGEQRREARRQPRDPGSCEDVAGAHAGDDPAPSSSL
jgi:hypothetical protein